jgi:hypothetical protein
MGCHLRRVLIELVSTVDAASYICGGGGTCCCGCSAPSCSMLMASAIWFELAPCCGVALLSFGSLFCTGSTGGALK